MVRFLGLRGARLGSAISAVCGLCFLCFGYAQGVLGGLLTVSAFVERFPQIDTVNNSSRHAARLQGITVGTWNLGCFASAILTIAVGDYFGRRRTLLLGLVLWTIGEVIQCSSHSIGQLIAGRFIAGFGNGFTTATIPAYQAECVRSHRKGSMLMISAGAFIAFGITLSYWVVFAFAYVSNASASWRVPIAVQIVFALLAAALVVFLPESPRWLISTGQEQEALTVLAALNDDREDSPGVRNEFRQIRDAIAVMSQGSTASMFSSNDRRGFHRVVLAHFVQVFQQVSGINLVLQYLSIMFATQQSHTPLVARLLGGCASTEYFLATFIAVVGIDRFWGRRALMMFGSTGMCASMVLLAILGYLWEIRNVDGTNVAGTVLLFCFSTFFAIGWQGMAWLYQVEVVPLHVRGPANALSTSANWLLNFVVVSIAPISFRTIGYKTYIIFACTNFLVVPLVYFFYPETAHRTLAEVDMLFQLANERSGNAWLSVVQISKEEPLWLGRNGNEELHYAQSDWHQRFTQYSIFSASRSTLGRGREKGEYTTPASGTAFAPVPPSYYQPLSSVPPSRPHSPRLAQIHNIDSRSSSHPLVRTTNHNRNQFSIASAFSASSTYSHSYSHTRKTSHGPALTPALAPGTKDQSYLGAFSTRKSAQSGQSMFSAYSDPDWRNSDMAPAPLRILSRPSTMTSSVWSATETERSESGWYSRRLNGLGRGDSGVLGIGDGTGPEFGVAPPLPLPLPLPLLLPRAQSTASSYSLQIVRRGSVDGMSQGSEKSVARDAGRDF